MGYVVSSNKLALGAWTLQSYIANFLGMVKDHRIVLSTVPIGNIADFAIGQLNEELSILDGWMGTQTGRWRIPTNPRYHKFFSNERPQLVVDWLPPVSYFVEVIAPSIALPQEPQRRVRIPDPTDVEGKKRSIRVHLEGKVK